MSVLALVPAAGDGVRLGAGMAKALVQLGGVPLVVRAVRGLVDSGVVDHVLVAVREADLSLMGSLFDSSSFEDSCGPGAAGGREPEPARRFRLGSAPVEVVVGGVDRSASVAAALWEGARRHPEADTVLVHDAARALTPPDMVKRLVAAVAEQPAVVPVLPVADTVKEVDPAGTVVGTADRSVLRAVQTPQAFRLELLRRAYQAAGYGPEASGSPTVATDDAGLVERLGEPVRTVPGDPLAFKITTPWDLRLAELLVGS